MHRTRLLALAVAVVGCSSSHETKPATPPPSPAPAAERAPAPPANQAPESAKVPKELAALAKNAALQAGPFAWPAGGTSAIFADDVMPEQSKLVWHGPTGDGTLAFPRTPARAVLKDVTKDGTPELVVFAKPPAKALDWFDDQTMTWVVGVDPKAKKPAQMWLVEMQVMGATDEASFDKDLATIGTFAPSATVSPIRAIARLETATPAELQALVGAPGLKLCKRQGEKKSCKKVAQKEIDAAKVKAIASQGGTFAAFAPADGDAGYDALQPPACNLDEKNPKLLLCTASVGGPAGGSWTFEKTASGLRLAEVWSWAEDS